MKEGTHLEFGVTCVLVSVAEWKTLEPPSGEFSLSLWGTSYSDGLLGSVPVSQLAGKRGDLNLLMDKVCSLALHGGEGGDTCPERVGKETFQNIEVGEGLAS